MDFFGLLTRIAAVVSALLILATFGVNGAPQEAALASLAVALVVVPYVVYRVLQTQREAALRRTHETLVLKALESLEEAIRAGRATGEHSLGSD